MHALILAGGFATRLWPLTEHRAKPLLQLNGKTILAHIIEQIPTEVPVTVLTNARFAADFEVEIARYKRTNVSLFLEDAHTDGQKLGAMKAVSYCVETQEIDDDVAVLAGDNILQGFDFESLHVESHTAKMLLQDINSLHDARRFGVSQLDEKGQVVSFEEKPEHPKSTLVSTGFFAFGRKTLPHIHAWADLHPDNLGGVMGHLLAENVLVTADIFAGTWFDVGSFETYLEAHKTLSQHTVLPAGNTATGVVFAPEDTQITDSHLHNTLVYGGAKIHDCRLVDCVVDAGAQLSHVDLHGVLVRAGTVLTGRKTAR